MFNLVYNLNPKRRLAPALGLIGVLSTSACGDDEGDGHLSPNEDAGDEATTPGEERTSEPHTMTRGAETTGHSDNGETLIDSGSSNPDVPVDATVTDSAPDSGGVWSETDSGSAGPKAASWIVGGWLSTEEGYFGYLTILDDLSAEGEVDLGKVHQFVGDITYTSAGDGKVFVGQADLSTVERWVVNEAGDGLEKDGEINFEYFGVTSTLGNDAIQLIDEETAWYFDTATYQVIVFDPTTLTTEGETIDFSGILEGDNDLVLGFVSRLDDSFVVSAQYWDPDGNALSLTRAAIIDIGSHDVTYADDTRCGSTRFHVKDDAGNLYIGAHPGESLWQAAGLGSEDAPEACLVRIKSGETDFDPEYYVDLGEISGGKVVGGFLQGDDNHAYVYEFTGDVGDVNEENYMSYVRGDRWALARLELGNEAESYRLVDNYEASTAYGASFAVTVGHESVRYVISANSSFESGRYYDLSNPTKAVEALSFPGFPGDALNY